MYEVVFEKFMGINNVASEFGMPAGWLTEAENVYIDSTYKPVPFPAGIETGLGNLRQIWSNGDVLLLVSGTTLYGTTDLVNINNLANLQTEDEVSFTSDGKYIYCTNGTVALKVEIVSLIVSEWGGQLDTAPDTTLSPIPVFPATKIERMLGTIFLAVGKTLYYTTPFAPDYIDGVRGHINFEDPIIDMVGSGGFLLVSTTTKVMSVDAEFRIVTVLEEPAIPGSMVSVSLSNTPLKTGGMGVLFATDHGLKICDRGAVAFSTDDYYKPYPSINGATITSNNLYLIY